VDGSFTSHFAKAGWSFVVTEGDKELARGHGITAFDAESRNIDGEVMASFQAMKWLEANDRTGTICHDYEGIARWARGEWKAKSSIAQQYVRACQPYLKRVTFEKVAAHTGVKWNELADELAKGAIKKAQDELENSKK
jgi:ribonuclease HI